MGLLDLLFPKFCIQCHQFGNYICPSCIHSITRHKQICIVCSKTSPQGKTHSYCQQHTHLNGAILATEYKNITAKALHKIKYNSNYDILNELLDKTIHVPKIQQCLQQEQINLSIPIPLYPHKYKSRGFNQTLLISQWLQQNFQIPYLEALIKTKSTQPQMSLSRNERLFNLKNTFQLNEKISPTQLEGKNILLIDDVITTGSTIQEAAKPLHAYNPQKIWTLAIASGK